MSRTVTPMNEDDVPNEYRIDCAECGADGGTYDFRADFTPAYCPWCGAEADASDVRIIEAAGEPTALTYEE